MPQPDSSARHGSGTMSLLFFERFRNGSTSVLLFLRIVVWMVRRHSTWPVSSIQFSTWTCTGGCAPARRQRCRSRVRCTKRSVTEHFLSPPRRSGTHCQRRPRLCRLSTVLGALWRLSCLSGRSAVRGTGHNHSEKTVTLQQPWSSSGLASLWNSWMMMVMKVKVMSPTWVLPVLLTLGASYKNNWWGDVHKLTVDGKLYFHWLVCYKYY